jgi:hypothetical protein
LQTLTASNSASIGQINSVTASLNTATSSYETKGRGIVSGSSQITLSSTTGGGTSDTPQFGRIGIGKAADANIAVDITTAVGALQATTTGQSVTAYVLKATNAAFDNSLFYGNTTRAGSSAFKLLDLRTDGGSTNKFYIDGNGTGYFASDVTASNFIGGIKSTNGVVSGSSQVNFTQLSGISNGIVSGSSQTIANLPTGTISGSSQVNFTQLSGISNGIVSGSSQTIANLPTGTVSGSSQVNFTQLSGISNGIVSGSSQTIANLPTGTISGSSQVVGSSITTNTITIAGQSTALGSSVTAETIRTAIGTVVTGSAQISLTATTGYGTYLNQAVLTTSSPTFAALTINGAITATGDITAYYTSDKRHKNTIQLIPNALEKVSKLNGVTWEWNDDVHEVTKSTPKTGLIAQEVQEVLPEVVKTRDDGFLALDYSKMMGLMVEAIKEQQTQIHSLTIEIEKLKESKGL